MTICEYIRAEYEKYINTPDKQKGMLILSEKSSYEYVKNFCDYVCGGGWDYQLAKAGITQEQIDKALASKYIKVKHYSNWENRMRGQTTLYLLTAKGIKAMYNHYKEW